jgi:hypothetical protein
MKTFLVIVVTGLFFFFTHPSYGQGDEDLLDTVHAEFYASHTTPKVGEPFEFTLNVTYPSAVTLLTWPEVRGRFGDFEIQVVGDIHTQDLQNGIRRTSQTFTAVLWRVGDYATPDAFITYQRIGEADIFTVPVTEAFFSVISILPSQDLNTLEPFPNRQAIWLFYIPEWGFGLGGILLVGITVAGIWAWRNYRLALAKRNQPRPLTPIQLAYDSLEGAELLTSTGEQINAVAHTLRRYLSQRFTIPATGMTTDEIKQTVDERGLEDELYADNLYKILDFADKIKFANAEPTRQLIQRIFHSAREWLFDVEQEMGQ